MQKRLLAHWGLLFVTTALMPLLVNCEVDAVTTPPPATPEVTVTAPPPQATVDVNATPPPDQTAAPTEVADTDPSALQDFHEALDPYGSWVDDPSYGTVWYPNPGVVGGDFTPYQTAGHWVYDNNDYLWVSDYDWGWAPFHYGRWLWTPRGWGWVPGHEYAGAWVTWRNGDDGYGYAGWAPTPPTYYWRGGVAVNIVNPPEPRFVYVQTTDLFAPNIGVRVLPRARYREIETHTRVYAPQPGVGGSRVVVRGPPPTRFGINANAIARPPANNPGLARAQQFRTRPVTATRPMNPTGPQGGQVRPGNEFRNAPPGQQQPQGGVRPSNEFRNAPPGAGQQPQGGQPMRPMPPSDVRERNNDPQRGGGPQQQLPPDARTRPVTPTPQQMHAAPPPTTNRPVAPPPRKR